MQVIITDVDTRGELDRLETTVQEVSLMIQVSSFAIDNTIYSVIESEYDYSKGITFLYVEVLDN